MWISKTVQSRTNKNEWWNLENGRKRLDWVYFVLAALFAQVPSCREKETATAHALTALCSANDLCPWVRFTAQGLPRSAVCPLQCVPSSTTCHCWKSPEHFRRQNRPDRLDKALRNLVWRRSWPCLEQDVGLETSWCHLQPELSYSPTNSPSLPLHFGTDIYIFFSCNLLQTRTTTVNCYRNWSMLLS